MATTVSITHQELVPLASALNALGAWIRPGMLALRVGQILAAVRPDAQRILEERERLIDECALYEGEGDQRKRKVRPVGPGMMEVMMQDPAEFRRREQELLGGAVEIAIVRLLTEADITKLEKELVAKQEGLPPVDFAALAPVFEGTAVIAPHESQAA